MTLLRYLIAGQEGVRFELYHSHAKAADAAKRIRDTNPSCLTDLTVLVPKDNESDNNEGVI